MVFGRVTLLPCNDSPYFQWFPPGTPSRTWSLSWAASSPASSEYSEEAPILELNPPLPGRVNHVLLATMWYDNGDQLGHYCSSREVCSLCQLKEGIWRIFSRKKKKHEPMVTNVFVNMFNKCCIIPIWLPCFVHWYPMSLRSMLTLYTWRQFFPLLASLFHRHVVTVTYSSLK